MREVWMLLTPYEQDAVRVKVPDESTGPNVVLLRTLQGKLRRVGADYELSIDAKELAQVRAAYAHWKGGYGTAFKAILDAAYRHGH